MISKPTQNAKKSKRWMQTAVRDYGGVLNARICSQFAWPGDVDLMWVSPRESDGYKEFRTDEAFEKLGLSHLRSKLGEFWPSPGACWDAIGRTSSGKLIWIEAKAHISEGLPNATKATDPASLALISKSLGLAKSAFSAHLDANWAAPFYQYTNRLAHLFCFRELLKLDAYLLFLYFADAPDTTEAERTGAQEWQGAKRVFESALGLSKRHPFHKQVQTHIWSVPDMLSGR